MDRIELKTNTEKSELSQALILLRRFTVFIAPLVVLTLIGEWLMWRGQENWPVSQVIDAQEASSAPLLYSRTLLSQQFGPYKLQTVRARKPSVLVIGSSRVMQFRPAMFDTVDASFYNAGGMIQCAEDLRKLASQLRNGDIATPDSIIVGIDPWWLKTNWNPGVSNRIDSIDDAYRFAAHMEALKTLARGIHISDLLETGNKALNDTSSGSLNIGVAAQKHGCGFRRDGSWRYPRDVRQSFHDNHTFVEREKPSVLHRIMNRDCQFAKPLTTDPEKYSEVSKAIKSMIEMEIETWVLMPPFSTESLSTIRKDPELAALWGDYRSLYRELASCGAKTVTLKAMDAFELPDSFMIDGFHPGEVYSARIALEIVRQASEESFFGSADADRLASRIENATAPLVLGSSQNQSVISLLDAARNE